MKRFFTFAAVAVLSFLLISCAKDAEVEPTSEPTLPPVIEITPTPESTPEPTPTPPPYDGQYSPLSGLPIADEYVSSRPLAIMINNRKIAQPQHGIGSADIVFEIPAEADITRMLAIFQNPYDAGVIGSVRSSRPYYIEFAEGFDAIYVCAGGSDDAYVTLKNHGVTYLDGVNGSRQQVFFRDTDRQRTKGYEHSLMTSGELLAKHLPTYSNFRLEHNDDYSVPYAFEPDTALSSATAGGSVTIDFFGKKSTLKYDAATDLYALSQHGTDSKDGNTGEAIAFTNVIVMKTAINAIRGDTEGRRTMKTTGSGEALYFLGGQYIEITWEKASASAPLIFKTADGEVLTMRSGRTYIAVMSTDGKLVIE